MKHIPIIVLLLGIPLTATAQDSPRGMEYYERHTKIKPFYMRWYNQLRGEEITVQYESLTLMADNRYEHYFGGHLAGATYGRWTNENNMLILKADSVWGVASMDSETYFIKKRRLYKQASDREWIMKKKF